MLTANALTPAFADVLPPQNGRRTELAASLRARRPELRPERVGLPLRARRGTAGLRREEVAELAVFSVGLHAWLEQGRDVPVSERTIEAVQWELVAQSMLETFRFRLTPHLENRRARRLVNSLYGASVREQSSWQILDAPERNREDDDVVPASLSGNANIALSGRCPARCRTLKIRGASAAAVRRSRVRATFAHL